MPHRMSLLNYTQHCGLVAKLARENPTDSPAARLGTWIHRLIYLTCVHKDATEEDRKLHDSLSEEDLALASSIWSGLVRWFQPPPGAQFEVEVEYCGIIGHADMMWVEDGVVKILDWKTGEMAVEPPQTNLTLHAYGLGGIKYFSEYKLSPEPTRYQCGLCYLRSYADGATATDDPGSWGWGDVYDVGAMNGPVIAAANTPEEPTEGPWCLSCWQREFCPAYRETALAISPTLALDNLPKIIPQLLALEKLCAVAKQRVKELIGDGQVDLGNGYVYRGWPTKGRKSVDTAKLKSDGIYDIYAKAGAPFLTWDARKVKP